MNTVPYVQQGMSSQYTGADPAVIVVFGSTGVGKSTFVNDASRADLQVGHGLASSTKEVQTSPVFQLNGRSVQLYDTPGFDDTSLTDTEILKRIAEFLEGMQVFLALDVYTRADIAITDNRMTGASVRSFELFTKICGLSTMRNVMIVTNMWSFPVDPEEERREDQLKASFFKIALDNGAKMARRAGVGSQSARGIVQVMLNLAPIDLQLPTEIARGLPLDATQAGIVVDQNLRVRLERQRREKEELEEELEAARQDRDRRAQEQLERYKRDREEEEQILRQQIELLRQSRRIVAANARQPAPGPSPGTSPTSELADEHDRGGGRPTGFSSQGSGVLLDFVGRATPAERTQSLLTDALLLVFQLVQLAVAYETTCWAPEVPDPLFTPPPQSQNPVATTQTSSRSRTRPRDRRTRSGTSSSNPRTTRAGYRDVLIRRSRHVRTSTSNFHPDTPIIDLPLRTLFRLLTRSFVLGEDVSLPGPVTEFRQRIGIVSEVMAALTRMRAARQEGTEGQAPGVAAAR
ncbi:hypothetical protein FRC06_006351 [Ceratobasidium sp. 370]|nr:hypothetical protein FRC06_006351 [Ceratobasidium sp. 370]